MKPELQFRSRLDDGIYRSNRLVAWKPTHLGAFTKKNLRIALVKLITHRESIYGAYGSIGGGDGANIYVQTGGSLWRAETDDSDDYPRVVGWLEVDPDDGVLVQDGDPVPDFAAEGDEIVTYADVLDQADTVWNGQNLVSGDPAGFMAAAGIDSVSGDVFNILRYDDLCTPETNAGYTPIYYEDSNTREAMFNLPDDYDDIQKIAAAAAIELFECDLSCNDINGIRIPNICVAVSNEDIDEMITAAEKFIAEYD